MAVGPGVLKLAGGLGAAAVVGASALAVAADAKPAGAPLKPPVSGASSTAAVESGGAGSAGTLSIPVTPVCQKGTGGAAIASAGARPTPAATATAALDPAVAAAVQQLKTAKTAKQRQAVMAALTADQRMQLTAYIAAHRPQPATSATSVKGGTCRGAGGAGQADSGIVAPTVVDAGPAAPLVVSAVS